MFEREAVETLHPCAERNRTIRRDVRNVQASLPRRSSRLRLPQVRQDEECLEPRGGQRHTGEVVCVSRVGTG